MASAQDHEVDTIPFLGTGWGFPPSFSAGGAQVALVSGVQDIHQSLQLLLTTSLGERVMNEGFGCDLVSVTFAEADQSLVNKISSLVNDAILDHEPRIRLIGLKVSQPSETPEKILIRLDYHVPETNTRYNMVYPFYLNEATAAR